MKEDTGSWSWSGAGRGHKTGASWKSPRKSREIPVEGRSWTSRKPISDDVPGIGKRVFHQKFGYGSVRAVEGQKLTIAFEKSGTKKVMAAFVTAA